MILMHALPHGLPFVQFLATAKGDAKKSMKLRIVKTLFEFMLFVIFYESARS